MFIKLNKNIHTSVATQQINRKYNELYGYES